MKDIYIGTSENEFTGVTAVIAPKGLPCGVSVRGGGPGSRETEVLKNDKAAEFANAVVLTGGSAFGLGSCDGVMRYLHEQGSGVKVGNHNVPLVAGAVIFDIIGQELIFPTAEMGYAAASGAVKIEEAGGRIKGLSRFAGAGRGATCGKLMGGIGAERAGMGSAFIRAGNIEMAAVAVVNAIGDIFDYRTNRILAGLKGGDGKYIDSEQFMLSGAFMEMARHALNGKNTTICAVMTNATLAKKGCNRLADIAHDGLARAVRPVHTDMDGDTVFAFATCEVEAEFNTLTVMAAEAVRLAIVNAVTD